MKKDYVNVKISDPKDRGYIMYRKYNDGVYVMMGSYTDPKYRGSGVFKECFVNLMNDMKSGDTLQAAACSKILAKYLQEKIPGRKTRALIFYNSNKGQQGKQVLSRVPENR